jgi:hypothetical protein
MGDRKPPDRAAAAWRKAVEFVRDYPITSGERMKLRFLPKLTVGGAHRVIRGRRSPG